jgi:hypothetical protein
MIPWGRVLVTTVSGGFLGAIVYTLFTLLCWAIFTPGYFRDGQGAMVFFMTVPYGFALGGIAAATATFLVLGKVANAGWVSLVGGGLIGGLLLLTLLSELSGQEPPDGLSVKNLLLSLVHPGVGIPVLWPLAEMVWGVMLLRRE